MREYQLDVEKSKDVFGKCERHIRLKHCYNNVFEVVTDYMTTFRSGEWKVAYGYVSVMANVFCRHCFVVDQNGKAIDPTIFTNTDPDFQRQYFAMKIFDDVDVYLDAIESEDYMPALGKYLRDDEKQAHEWANEKGYVLIA